MHGLDDLTEKVVIAKGWVFEQDDPPSLFCLEGKKAGWWIPPSGDAYCANCQTYDIPDYANDIAAAMQLENEIPEELRLEYSYWLQETVGNDLKHDPHLWDLIHASPAQRCRAYLAMVKKKQHNE